MDITNRLEMLRECGIADDIAYKDLLNIIDVVNDFGIVITEENGGAMITHFAAAFKRTKTGETIPPISQVALDELKKDSFYSKCLEILKSIQAVSKNQFNSLEQDFALLHICTLLYSI